MPVSNSFSNYSELTIFEILKFFYCLEIRGKKFVSVGNEQQLNQVLQTKRKIIYASYKCVTEIHDELYLKMFI